MSFIFLSVFLYAFSYIKIFLQNQESRVFAGSISDSVSYSAPQEPPVVEPVAKPMPQIDLTALSAISVETNMLGKDQIVYEKNSSTQLPIASLTKLMTAVVVLDNYDISSKIIISKTADLQDPVKQDVKFGDELPVESLMYVMLIGSSNKSAYALAEGPEGWLGEKKFVELMNEKARYFGLENTFFADPTGLSSKNVSTANDLAKLALRILKDYPKIAQISKASDFFVPSFGKIVNTNRLLAEVPDAVCSKTGFTTDANGCLLLAIHNSESGDYLINVILGSNDRFSEMKKLISLTCSLPLE